MRRVLLLFSLPVVPLSASMALAQQPNPAVQPALVGQVSSLSPDILYKSWRARQLLGQRVLSNSGQIGTVRDLVVDKDGTIAGLIVEGGGVLGIPEAVYRIPWSNVNLTPGKKGVKVDLSSSERPQYGLFPGTDGVPQLPREFRITEIIGDYVRLQTGYGYGSVSDAVFSKDGRVTAVLVSRDKGAGGGTFAFPFSGYGGLWDPGLSYFGLPFTTTSQAMESALHVDPKRFAGTSM